jgi:hypothetical protein
MDYTQQGVLNIQLRAYERLKRLLAERDIWLDSGPIWFDGNMALPTPGDPWKLALSSHGESATVEFTPAELDDFIAARPYEVVSQKLGRALDSLRPRK